MTWRSEYSGRREYVFLILATAACALLIGCHQPYVPTGVTVGDTTTIWLEQDLLGLSKDYEITEGPLAGVVLRFHGEYLSGDATIVVSPGPIRDAPFAGTLAGPPLSFAVTEGELVMPFDVIIPLVEGIDPHRVVVVNESEGLGLEVLSAPGGHYRKHHLADDLPIQTTFPLDESVTLPTFDVTCTYPIVYDRSQRDRTTFVIASLTQWYFDNYGTGLSTSPLVTQYAEELIEYVMIDYFKPHDFFTTGFSFPGKTRLISTVVAGLRTGSPQILRVMRVAMEKHYVLVIGWDGVAFTVYDPSDNNRVDQRITINDDEYALEEPYFTIRGPITGKLAHPSCAAEFQRLSISASSPYDIELGCEMVDGFYDPTEGNFRL
ncbi:MAG: hypothetical protein HN368_18055, partial [Spirochaetales bacterium]|nr:hypothetical protein [Spirochaetales bacterium]